MFDLQIILSFAILSGLTVAFYVFLKDIQKMVEN